MRKKLPRKLNPIYISKCCQAPIRPHLINVSTKDEYLIPTVRQGIEYRCGQCNKKLKYSDFVRGADKRILNARDSFGIWWKSQHPLPPTQNFGVYRKRIERLETLLAEARDGLQKMLIYRAEQRAGLRAWTAVTNSKALLKKWAKKVKKNERWWPEDLEVKKDEK